MAKVSIIICTFDRAHLIGEAIRSTLSQTFTDFELLVIDDGSTDNTRETVGAIGDPRIRYLHRVHSNGYLGSVRNTGLREARGEYIAFLDSDDLWMPAKLRSQIEALDADIEAGFSFTDIELLDESGSLRPGIYDKQGVSRSNIFSDYIHNKFVIYTSTLIFRRSCLESVGLFDETLFDSDFDFILSLAARFDATAFYSPMVRIRKQRISHSHIINRERMDGYLKTVMKAHDRGEITGRQYKAITSNLSYAFGAQMKGSGRYDLAYHYFKQSVSLRILEFRAWVQLARLIPRRINGFR